MPWQAQPRMPVPLCTCPMAGHADSCYVCTVKIGRPGYRVTKQFDGETRARSLLFQVRTSVLLD